MSQHVQCLVCGEVLKYEREDTWPLLEHLRTDHPQLVVTRMVVTEECKQKDGLCDPAECEKEFRDRLSREKDESKLYCENSQTNGNSSLNHDSCRCCKHCGKGLLAASSKHRSRRYHSTGRLSKRTKNESNRMQYLTTVETWRPGCGLIMCPKCGYKGQPIVRKRQSKICDSPLGAMIMLGCWPVCFLPFVLSDTQIVHLHCYQCQYYLGTYDRKKSILVKRCSATQKGKPFDSSISAPTICMCNPPYKM